MNMLGLAASAAPDLVTTRRYPRALRILHWSLAALFTTQFALILVLKQLESLELGQMVLDLHRQCGTAILLIVLIRLTLGFRTRLPGRDFPRWQVIAASVTHIAMFVALAAQPVLGLLIASARGDAVVLLGLVRLPDVLSLTTEQGVSLGLWHRWLAYGLMFLVGIHVCAILFNRIVRKTSVIGAMLPAAAPNRLVNRVPISVQLCCCFGLILAVTLGAGLYSAHQYAKFGELRSHFDETEVVLLDDMRATQIAVTLARVPSADAVPSPGQAEASAEAATAARDFVTRLSDPAARASARAAALAFGRMAKGDRSPAMIAAAAQGLQEAIDSQYLTVFQGRLAITQTAAIGHDMIVLALAPTIILCALLAAFFSRNILRALASARTMVRNVENDRSEDSVEVIGNGEFAVLMRDIVRMREAVALRQQAGHDREAQTARANEARESELARHASAREADIARRNALEQAQIVSEVGQGLSALVAGNLKYRISAPCAGDYDQIRTDFNEAMGRVEAAMAVISRSSGAIGASSHGVALAANELAGRTERQAAALSQTVTALDRMTDEVKASAAGALQVVDVVHSARRLAGQSDDIVGEAIAVMGDIEQSAEQIVNIVNTIEGIAAKSNLLALNARIEAARAGENGRGFAVVAQEVHTLARLARAAAGEIRTLAAESTRQIGKGVESVQRTGIVVHQIVQEMDGVDELVAGITDSAQQQAAGLDRLNRSMVDMDRVVRENTGMVQDTTVELRKIRDNAAMLDEMIKRLATDDDDRMVAVPTPVRIAS